MPRETGGISDSGFFCFIFLIRIQHGSYLIVNSNCKHPIKRFGQFFTMCHTSGNPDPHVCCQLPARSGAERITRISACLSFGTPPRPTALKM